MNLRDVESVAIAMFVDEPDVVGVSAIVSAFDAGTAVQDKDLLGEDQIGRSQKKRNTVKVSSVSS